MVGETSIGESPIGDGSSSSTLPVVVGREGFDWFLTIISQYANSPILLQLIENLATYIDPTTRFDDFYNLIWNIDTAQGYGLDVWGRIVGVSRVLQVPAGSYFGFTPSTTAQPFNQGVFYNGEVLTNNYALSDVAYRRLILAKALANITDGSIPSINQILLNTFPGYGNCYVVDNQNMSMTITFQSTLSPVDAAVLAQSGVLPRPAGVSVSIAQ